MSKFSELCNSYAMSRTTYFEYRDKSIDFAGALMQRYIAYLEIPEENYRYLPLGNEAKVDTKYSMRAALHLDDDACWHLGLQLTLVAAPNETLRQPVLITFMLQSKGDAYLVRIAESDNGHLIHSGNELDFSKFFDFLQSQIKRHFEGDFQRFLEQSAPMKKIGFILQ